MSDEPDPPRKFYGLKPREFETVNEHAPRPEETAPAPTSAPSEPSGPIHVQDLFRQAQLGPLLRKSEQKGPENDVHAVLRELHAKEVAAGLHDVTLPPRRRSRRKRDFWVLLIAGNSFIVAIYSAEMFLGFQVMTLASRMPFEFWNLVRYALAHPGSYALIFLGMAFYSSALTWLMFGMMEDY